MLSLLTPAETTGCSCRSLPQRWQPSLQHG